MSGLDVSDSTLTILELNPDTTLCCSGQRYNQQSKLMQRTQSRYSRHLNARTVPQATSREEASKLRQKLIEVDFTEEQTEAILEVCDKIVPDPATKADVHLAASQIQSQMKDVYYKLSSQIKDVDYKLSSQIKDVDYKLGSQIKDVDNKLSSQIEDVDYKLNVWFILLVFVEILTAVGVAGPDSLIGKVLTVWH